jgi:hypothetical protein
VIDFLRTPKMRCAEVFCSSILGTSGSSGSVEKFSQIGLQITGLKEVDWQ